MITPTHDFYVIAPFILVIGFTASCIAIVMVEYVFPPFAKWLDEELIMIRRKRCRNRYRRSLHNK